MIVIQNLTLRPGEPESKLKKLAARELKCSPADLKSFAITKKSLDARHGKVKFHLRYQVVTGTDRVEDFASPLPCYQPCPPEAPHVVVVGSGPAGLFASLKLIEVGILPILLERGNPAPQRKRDIAAISTRQQVNPDSNYCFGEGGAGTFSDGKLYTRSNKRGNLPRILQIFHQFGAGPQVLTNAHPHIGTDKLPTVIQAMTAKIRECGGQVHFGCHCTDLRFSPQGNRVVGVQALDNEAGQRQFLGDAVILATGHSATDVYQIISRQIPAALEDKTFAVGVRVEHPREVIDNIQFHGAQKKTSLGAAEYRLVTQVQQRGVYSFCMCPGGLVVPSASCQEGLVVNGMSPSSRGGRWSNAAIVVEIQPEDFELLISQLEDKLKETDINLAESLAACGLDPAGISSTHPCRSRGLYLRTLLEILTKAHGNGQQAPAQLLTDFLAGRDTQQLPRSTYTPGLVPSRLDQWLPPYIAQRLQTAFMDFNKKMRGFVCPQAVLIASETRTSTPTRILRDPRTLECVAAAGLYPAGEGAGYSGGIVSSAMDGEAVATAIIKRLQVSC